MLSILTTIKHEIMGNGGKKEIACKLILRNDMDIYIYIYVNNDFYC